MVLWTFIFLGLVVFNILAVSFNWPREWVERSAVLILIAILGLLYHLYKTIRSRFG